jgi:FixH protein
MNITWGDKLIIVFLVFGSMMTYMVCRSFGTRVDLVSNEYYNDELEYQQLIDGAQSASQTRSGPELVFAGRKVTVNPVDTFTLITGKGTAWFYCVSDSDKDQKVSLKQNITTTGALAEVFLKEGSYIAKLRWSTSQGNFYSEQKFTVK